GMLQKSRERFAHVPLNKMNPLLVSRNGIERVVSVSTGQVRVEHLDWHTQGLACEIALTRTSFRSFCGPLSGRNPRTLSSNAISQNRLTLLCHKFRLGLRGNRRIQHWHRWRVVAIATASRR